MIADVWRIVASAARYGKRRNAAGHKSARRHVVVDPGYLADVEGFGIENRLPARNGRSRIGVGQLRPGPEEVEGRRAEPAVARRQESARRLERRHQGVNARVDADEERLCDESFWPAVPAASIEAADSPVDCLRREEGGLEVHDRLLLGHGRSGPVSLGVAGGGRYRLVRQIAEQ